MLKIDLLLGVNLTLRNRRVGRPLPPPKPPTKYRLMWYTDLLSSHRGTSENTPPSLLFRRLSLTADYFFSLPSFPLSFLVSLPHSLSASISHRFFLVLHSFSPVNLSLSRFCKITAGAQSVRK
ncbi:hypothetical protein PUN28_007481 [Cardiocondyla obscurior]|uniref:Uncharacterized protein n=1 Tax=Cardiocondyla obscurior TaxID=286306 RepID=A0AAW2G8H4_9HYME